MLLIGGVVHRLGFGDGILVGMLSKTLGNVNLPGRRGVGGFRWIGRIARFAWRRVPGNRKAWRGLGAAPGLRHNLVGRLPRHQIRRHRHFVRLLHRFGNLVFTPCLVDRRGRVVFVVNRSDVGLGYDLLLVNQFKLHRITIEVIPHDLTKGRCIGPGFAAGRHQGWLGWTQFVISWDQVRRNLGRTKISRR